MESLNRKMIPALVFMLLFVGVLGIRIWASTLSSRITGPEHIAAGGDYVYVHAQDTLYVFSPRGQLIRQVGRAEAGLADTPIDMRVLADGRLLLAEQQPARIRLCHPETWSCSEIAGELTAALRKQYKLLVAEAQNRLLVVGSLTGMLWQWPLEPGRQASVLIDRGVLSRPNDILLREDRLWILDSGNHRLAGYSLDKPVRGEPGIELETNNRFVRYAHDWPVMLAMSAEGELWVTQSDAMGEGADLLVYDAGAGAVARIELPEDAYPSDVARLGEAMLVTDMDQFRVYRINSQSRIPETFGDAAFNRIMDAGRQARQRYLLVRFWSLPVLLVFGLLMILAAVKATPKARRWTDTSNRNEVPLAATTAAVPDSVGVHWLEWNPKTARLIRWILPMSILWAVMVCGIFLSLFFMLPELDTQNPEQLENGPGFRDMVVFFVIAISGVPFLVKLALRKMRYQLGADRNFLYLRTPEGRELSVRPEEVLYSGRYLAWNEHLLTIQTGNHKPLYKKGEVDTWIRPLLSRSDGLSAIGMWMYQFRQRDPVLIYTLIYFAVVIVAAILTGAWEPMFSGRR